MNIGELVNLKIGLHITPHLLKQIASFRSSMYRQQNAPCVAVDCLPDIYELYS